MLRMARDYRSSESWDNDAAKRWWEMHLLELTGPREKIEAALQWTRNEGVETSFIGLDGTDEWVVD